MFRRLLLAFATIASYSSATEDINGTYVFQHFVAHNDSMTCTADEHARPFNNQIRGVNLGGYMVLEPWITPSLFYQFLGKGENTTAFDMYTFCQVLGPKTANKQLRHHWETWVTPKILDELYQSGGINSLRLPVGDFQFVPYGPYKECVEGSIEYVEKVLDWSLERGITVLLDIHTMKDSQNGFDNSGQTMGFQWTSPLSSEFAGFDTFQHWPIRSARWIGDFDDSTGSYKSINYQNIQHALNVIERIVDMFGHHPAVLGLEPLNEPWQFTPMDVLKRFYWEGYLIVKRKAPYWKYVMHDSFRLFEWAGFMDGCPERALDTHIYQAWRDPDSRLGFYTDACGQKSAIAKVEREFGPVIVGEWSLATDNCAMWLNGFNDNLPGFPRLPCKYTPCNAPYLGAGQPGAPVDPARPMQGPYGTGMSGPSFGLCPGSRDWIKERDGPMTGKDWIRAPPEAPSHLDDTDTVMSQLALKKLDAFAGIGHGFFFWNFRTDLYEPQWSYMAAIRRGWIPKGDFQEAIAKACALEDSGDFTCMLKPGQLEKNIHKACLYIMSYENATQKEIWKVGNMTGSQLEKVANEMIGKAFAKYRHVGATCDFGGIVMLVEGNKTVHESPNRGRDYYTIVEDDRPYKLTSVTILLAVAAVALFGAFVGFIAAMRFNPGFRERVASHATFLPMVEDSIRHWNQGYEEVEETQMPLSF